MNVRTLSSPSSSAASPSREAERHVLLSARGISKSFAGTTPPTVVLRQVDLDIERGEYVAIMGPSGSGKSTLLYNVSGMDRPDSGTVVLDGKDLIALTDEQASEQRLMLMGFVFQQPHFLGNLAIRDNVLLPALKANKHGADAARTKIDELLERFGLAQVADHGITEVSGGQLQRAAICRALGTEPLILFADEPTGALNSANTLEVLDAFQEVQRLGTTVMMVTHDPNCAARADRVVYLRDGEVLDSLTQGTWDAASAHSRQERLLEWLQQKGF